MSDTKKYPCPCCNSPTIEIPGDYEICEICNWEDDPIQSEDPEFAGGANQTTLNEARIKFKYQKTKDTAHA